MIEPITLVTRFIETWERGDADEMAAFFIEDGVYHNMPIEPVRGRTEIREFLASYLARMKPEKFLTVNMASNGNLVMVERLDTFRSREPGHPRVELPVVGVFETAGDRIAAWRDYFDFAAFTRALAG
jgi:limonene-1,2-epoxide hydrolase